MILRISLRQKPHNLLNINLSKTYYYYINREFIVVILLAGPWLYA